MIMVRIGSVNIAVLRPWSFWACAILVSAGALLLWHARGHVAWAESGAEMDSESGRWPIQSPKTHSVCMLYSMGMLMDLFEFRMFVLFF